MFNREFDMNYILPAYYRYDIDDKLTMISIVDAITDELHKYLPWSKHDYCDQAIALGYKPENDLLFLLKECYDFKEDNKFLFNEKLDKQWGGALYYCDVNEYQVFVPKVWKTTSDWTW